MTSHIRVFDNETHSLFEKYCLKLENKAEKGIGLVAERSFKPGSTLIQMNPEVYAPTKEYRELVCHNCLQEAENLMRCNKCYYITYCSSQCKRKLDTIHKYECAYLASVYPNVPSETVIIASRVILLLKHEAELKTKFEIILKSLLNHRIALISSELEKFSFLSGMIKKFLKTDMAMSSIIDILCTMKSNCFNILNFAFEPIGVGLYFIPALINHSCKPNCVGTFDGPSIKITTVSDIQKGEEITVPYIEIAHPKELRQRELSEHFFFKCNCDQCTSDQYEEIVSQCNRDHVEFGDYQTRIETNLELSKTNLDPVKKTAYLLKALDAMNNIYSKTHYKRLMCYNDLFNIYISSSEWQKSLKCVKEILNIYERIYPKNWPLVGIRYYELGKLEWLLHRTQDAIESLEKARTILTRYYSRNHEFEKLCLLINEAHMELSM